MGLVFNLAFYLLVGFSHLRFLWVLVADLFFQFAPGFTGVFLLVLRDFSPFLPAVVSFVTPLYRVFLAQP